MCIQLKKLMPGGLILVVFLLLAACGSAGGNTGTGTGGTHVQGSKPSATVPPRLVTPKAARGSPGTGPLVISSPTPLPGGKPGSQQIVMGNRTLIIYSVGKQNGVSPHSILINLNLAVQNSSAKAIMNLPAFFQLVGSEGDTFGYQYNSSDTFYGTIAAHTTRSGTIVFQLPTAAASGLRLLYHPEIAADTAIVLLKIS